MGKSVARSIGLGARLKKLRETNKWTQAELARNAGTSQGGVNLIETGGRDDIRASSVIKYATALHVTTDEILGYDVNAIPASADAAGASRLDAVEKGLLELGSLLRRVDAKIDGQQQTATSTRKKSGQPKRS